MMSANRDTKGVVDISLASDPGGSGSSSGGPEHQQIVPWCDVFDTAVVSSVELPALDIPKRPSLIGHWWKEGDLGYVCAARGVGKTHFSMMLANSVAGQTKHIGPWDCPGNVRVLYVDGEMPVDDIRDRDRSYLNTGSDSNVHYLNHEVVFHRSGREINIVDPDFQSELLAYCKSNDVKVVFFDNLSSLALGMDENNANDWEKVKPWLLRVRRAGISVVIVHHAGKSGKMRGTSKREDDTFWIIELEDDKDDSTEGAKFKMRFTKNRNDPGRNQVFSWHLKPQADGNILPEYRKVDPQDDFLELVKGGITRNKEIAEAMGCRPDKISKMARKLKDAGRIEIDNGRYFLAK